MDVGCGNGAVGALSSCMDASAWCPPRCFRRTLMDQECIGMSPDIRGASGRSSQCLSRSLMDQESVGMNHKDRVSEVWRAYHTAHRRFYFYASNRMDEQNATLQLPSLSNCHVCLIRQSHNNPKISAPPSSHLANTFEWSLSSLTFT